MFRACRWWHRRLPLVGFIGLVAASTGCGGDGNDSAPMGPDFAAARQLDTGAGEDRELQGIARFGVTLVASGEFRPGQPLLLHPEVSGLRSSPSSEVRVTVPDLDSTSLFMRGSSRPGTGARIRALAAEQTALATGQRWSRAIPVTFAAPGYYRIILTATDTTGPHLENGRAVRTSAYTEAWALITNTGGQLTSAFDASLVPSGYVPAPGAFQVQPASIITPNATCNPDVEDCTPGNTRVCEDFWIYFIDPNASQFLGLSRADVTGTITTASGGYVASINTTTDVNGSFRVCTSSTLYRYQFTVKLQNADVKLRKWIGVAYQDYVAYSASGQFVGSATPHSVQAITDNRVSLLFINFAEDVIASRQLFTYARGHINVNIDESISGKGAVYHSGGDDIDISINETSAQRVAEITAHEYGHAVNAKALGGLEGGNCPSPHTWAAVSNITCALSEGFAEFHAAYTRGTALSLNEFYIEENYYLKNAAQYAEVGGKYQPITTEGSENDGATIEGAVAAFLYDLVDGPASTNTRFNTSDGTDDDPVQFPGSYVAEIFRTCQMQTLFSGWFRANGIDHIIYCIENQLDPAVVNSSVYFTSRSIDPVAIQYTVSNPSGWTQQTLRALWTKNLYTDATLPAPGW